MHLCLCVVSQAIISWPKPVLYSHSPSPYSPTPRPHAVSSPDMMMTSSGGEINARQHASYPPGLPRLLPPSPAWPFPSPWQADIRTRCKISLCDNVWRGYITFIHTGMGGERGVGGYWRRYLGTRNHEDHHQKYCENRSLLATWQAAKAPFCLLTVCNKCIYSTFCNVKSYELNLPQNTVN